MQFKIFFLFFIFFLFYPRLWGQQIFCDQTYRVGIVPFGFLKENRNIHDFQFLSRSLPKMIFSFLRNRFFIQIPSQLLVYTNFQNRSHNVQCPDYSLLKFHLKDAKENFTQRFYNENDMVIRLKDMAIVNGYKGILTGLIDIDKSTIQVTILYMDISSNFPLWKKNISLDKNDLYKSEDMKTLELVAKDLQNFLVSKNSQWIQIQNFNSKDYYVYVNRISYGKNIKTLSLPEGNFTIEIFQENCFRTYISDQLVNSQIIFRCSSRKKVSKIQIISQPDEADVYIDEKFIGKTPLNVNLSKGVYRIRISRKNYIDKFYVVDLNRNPKKNIIVNLQKGNNQKYYYQKKYAIGNWTYYDLSFGLAIQSLFFAGGWVYSNIQKEKVLDSVRSPFLPSLVNFYQYSLLQFAIIEKARLQSLYWHRQGQIFASMGVLSLVASGIFLYKGIQVDISRSYEYGTQFHFAYQWEF